MRMRQRLTRSDDRLVQSWLSIRDGYRRAYDRVGLRVERATDLPPAWSDVLRFVRRLPEQHATMNQLASELGMTSGGLTRLVDRMTETGLLVRSSVAGDRRVVLAGLTAHGAELAEQASEAEVAALRTEIFAALSSRQVSELTALMSSLTGDEPA